MKYAWLSVTDLYFLATLNECLTSVAPMRTTLANVLSVFSIGIH